MTKKSKEQKTKEKLAALLGLENPKEQSPLEAHDVALEGEATLEYHSNPKSFNRKTCKREGCGRVFATRGSPVAYCSNECRIVEFEKRMGVKWRPDRSIMDRYGYLSEPLTVSPEGLEIADAVLALQAEQEKEEPEKEEPEKEEPEEPKEEIDVDALLAELKERLIK